MFRTAGLRLGGAIVMLVLLYQLILWTRHAENWRWLVNRPAASAQAAPAAASSHPDGGKTDRPISADRKSGTVPPSSPKQSLPPATGATDEDPEEMETFAEDVQGMTDGAMNQGRLDMFAYNRAADWVKNQSFERLDRRARRDLSYSDLYDQPNKHRGELVSLDVTVCLTRNGAKNEHDVMLSEVFATTEESRGRLYDLMVVDYPKEMPKGFNIREKARFAGYFLKLQGYESALTKPGQRPEKAPMLVGRLDWTPPPVAPSEDAAASDLSTWLWGGAAVAIVALGWAFWFFDNRRRSRMRVRPLTAEPFSGESIDQWLEQPTSEEEEENG
ncbi:MAG: hypothetical protein ABFC96_03915 [Thermoguttaceae bacterium]